MSPDLRLGRWQDVLGDVECDALITDPPYSERTHHGHDDGTATGNRVAEEYERERRAAGKPKSHGRVNARRPLGYKYWTSEDVGVFVGEWAHRTRGWFVALTDHVLAPSWEAALQAAGRYVFAPLHSMMPGSRVRLCGDGPSLWSTTIVVARPMSRAFQRWGALPGGYIVPYDADYKRPHDVIGGKPLWLMRALVRDYSRPGDLVCDPCAGGGTTLLAALTEGRRAVGAEMDPATHAKATARLARGYTPPLFLEERTAVQENLLLHVQQVEDV